MKLESIRNFVRTTPSTFVRMGTDNNFRADCVVVIVVVGQTDRRREIRGQGGAKRGSASWPASEAI